MEGVKNRVLRRIFTPKREKMVVGWRKLHNKELHNLYSSPNIMVIESRKMRWAGYVACMGDGNIYKILVRKSEGSSWHRCKDNIRMDLRETGWEGVGWVINGGLSTK
jgi:hypothetical protein